VDETLRYPGIPFSDQDSYVTFSVETVPPTIRRVDGQGALVVAAVYMAKGTHIFSHVHRIAQFGLEQDLDESTLLCAYREHLQHPLYFPWIAVNHGETNSASSFLEYLFYIIPNKRAFVDFPPTRTAKD
jgi:hypothetical protein